MSYPVMPLGFLGSQGDNDTYRIERSLRFNSADSAYLNRTPASAGNRKTWTWSGWVKRGALGSANYTLFSRWIDVNNFANLRFTTNAGDELRWYEAAAGVAVSQRDTTQVLRDPSAWYHIVLAYDTTQAVAADRAKLYLNGNQITVFATTANRAQNADGLINEAGAHQIGALNATDFFNGYLTEINFIDGQALTPSSFGETDAITGRWKAKAYSGTYGTNGFYLKFADNSGTTATTLGKDSSGNGNNWTPNNFSVTAGAGNDSLVDSPTNYGTDTGLGGEVRGNYCIINPLEQNSSTEADGNLQVTMASNDSIRGSMYVSSGKWYYEVEVTTSTDPYLGLASNAGQPASYTTNNAFGVNENGDIFRDNSIETQDSIAIAAGSVYMIAFDADAKKFWFGKDGQWYSCDRTPDITINVSDILAGNYGYDFSVLGGNSFAPHFGNSTTAGSLFKVNFGQRPFAYAAPSGFKALCTTNLSIPTIQKPSKYMDVVTYTGNGVASGRSIATEISSPDLVWIKSRSLVSNHFLFDSVRGATNVLGSNQTIAEYSNSDFGLGSGNFTIGDNGGTDDYNPNKNSATYVAWAWDEAPIAGMDIVSYTGNGDTSATRDLINHNLGVSPKMIIYKRRDATGGWVVWHSELSSATQSYLLLQSTNAVASSSPNTVQGTPSATAFRPRWTDASSGNNINNATYIAYLFAEVEGFSKFGSYTGNGSADGPFVWCGFSPKYLLIKRTDLAGQNWVIFDTARKSINDSNRTVLFAEASTAETTDANPTDIISSGFKVRNIGTGVNASGGTYIFAAFAESPFKYARAR